MPSRIRLRRHRGWRMPPNTINVTRAGKWNGKYGNPFKIGAAGVADAATAVTLLDQLIAARAAGDPRPDQPPYPGVDEIRADLRGKNLACFCREDKPCHGDLLLTIANGGDLR